MITESLVRAALDSVYDPCSIASNAPLGLGEMGLVRSVSIGADNAVDVVLTTTGPGCTMAGNIARAAIERLEAIAGIGTVTLGFDTRVMWTPAEMSAAGAARLDGARDRSAAAHPVRPQQWRDHVAPARERAPWAG